MPWPRFLYQSPEAAFTSILACFQRRSSIRLVPLSSPREAKGALAAAIFSKASTALLSPLTWAGSDSGPTMMKSLYISGSRFTP